MAAVSVGLSKASWQAEEHNQVGRMCDKQLPKGVQ